MHLMAMARAAGIILDWDDFTELSAVTPLLARVYPNGPADVNHFHASGGLAFIVRELRKGGLLCEDVVTAAGEGMEAYEQEPLLKDGTVHWRDGIAQSLNTDIVRPLDTPFAAEGGLKVLKGNLGRSVIKTSAVAPEHRIVEAPAIVFDDQDSFLEKFKAGRSEERRVWKKSRSPLSP